MEKMRAKRERKQVSEKKRVRKKREREKKAVYRCMYICKSSVRIESSRIFVAVPLSQTRDQVMV